MYDDEARDAAMDMPYDDIDARTAYGGDVDSRTAYGAGADIDARTAYGGGGGSPIDGSGSTSGAEDAVVPRGAAMGMGMNVLGKPIVTNNFVTKLYQ